MRHVLSATLAMTLLGCVQSPPPPPASDDYYGTTEPFAGEAIYLVMTDRFVSGDPDNDQRDQGGAHSTFDRPAKSGSD